MVMKINQEVAAALEEQKPVLALESTIISHGLPYPDNVECARMLETTARECGVVPATIGIIDGTIRIGLSDDEVVVLAKSKEVVKVSRPDIAYVVAQKRHGATTVAGTMLLAHRAGIKFFATGGIGGVHRQAENTFDISADLEELARTPVAVVSAGAKAILDISKTLEYLETKGVPVIGYGVDTFPLFYTRQSEYRLTQTVQDILSLARIVQTKFDILKVQGGILVANPIPAAAEMEHSYINGLIEQAVAEARQQEVSGKAVTPFLLGRICELSGGKSVAANLELVRNNVVVGSQLAVEYSKVQKPEVGSGK